MKKHPKVPRNPPNDLTFREQDYVTYSDSLWRIARTSGEHVLPWNQLRSFGPVSGQRWDPHLEPQSEQPERGVLYTATTLLTAAAEVWQDGRHIDPEAGRPAIVRFTPSRPLRLLNLGEDSTWPVRNGASAALKDAPRPVCRRWSSAILSCIPDLDGIYAPSTMTGSNIVLFTGGCDAVPAAADLHVSASDPGIITLLRQYAIELGYTIDTAHRV